MRDFLALAVGSLLVVIPGCETTLGATDSTGPKITVSDGAAPGFVASSDPRDRLRKCPGGAEPQLRGGIWSGAVYPAPEGTIRFSLLIADPSGVKSVRIQLPQNAAVSRISPATADYSDDTTVTHFGSVSVADLISIDFSSAPPRTGRGLEFDYAGPLSVVFHVDAVDFNDNWATHSFFLAPIADVC